jgi:hypothetical protein
METSLGKTPVPVMEMGAVDVPTKHPTSWAYQLGEAVMWDGHTMSRAASFLRTWNFPEAVKSFRARVEQALEEGIPDQRRAVLWNQRDGFLDDRYVPDIALGEDVENPFWRWQKSKSDTVRVAVCLDATCWWAQTAEVVQSRMVVAAGLASALESLDYEVSVVGGQLMAGCDGSAPRNAKKTASVMATVMKSEEEPLVDSGFAHFADTGLRRLMVVWAQDANGRLGPMTNGEWREMVEADLFVYIGSQRNINTDGAPYGATFGPKGEDVLHLALDGMSDIDRAVEQVEEFFQKEAS